MLVANFEYALVVCATQSAVAKAFTALQSRAARQASAPCFRHRLAPDVASLPAKRRVSPRPRREAAHAVVNLHRRPPPIDTPVFFFQHRRVAGFLMVLSFRSN